MKNKLLYLLFTISFIDNGKLAFQTNDVLTYYSLMKEECSIGTKIDFDKKESWCYTVYFSRGCEDSLEIRYLNQK